MGKSYFINTNNPKAAAKLAAAFVRACRSQGRRVSLSPATRRLDGGWVIAIDLCGSEFAACDQMFDRLTGGKAIHVDLRDYSPGKSEKTTRIKEKH